MFRVKKVSDWTFETSSTKGISVVFVGGGYGSLVLRPPGGTVRAWFNYKNLGVGVSAGVKMQKSFSASSSNEDMYSAGKIQVLEGAKGGELEYSDFLGICVMVEISASAVVGGSVAMVLTGIPADKLGDDVFTMLIAGGLGNQMAVDFLNQVFPTLLPTYSKAGIVFGGLGVSGVSLGILGSVGFISQGPMQIVQSHQPDRTTYDPATIKMVMHEDDPWFELPGDALFDFDKSVIKPAAESVLQKLGAELKKRSWRKIYVEGHTDSIGFEDYNMKLSRERAAAVKQWLVSRGYAKPSDVETIGRGEERPVAPNDNPAGRARNRRVVIALWVPGQQVPSLH